MGKGFSIAIQACICGGQIEPSAGFSWGELSGLFCGREGGGEVVSGIEAGCQLNPGSGILRAASGGGFCGFSGIAKMARCEAGGGEDRPGTRGLRIQAGGILGWENRFFKFALGKIKFAQPFRSIGIFWIEPIGLDHFLDGQIGPTGAEEQAGEEAVGLGLKGFFENREANVGFSFRQLLEGEAGDGTTEEKSGVLGMFFDDLGDRLFRLCKILVEHGLFGRGDSGIEEGVFIRPFGKGADIGKVSRLAGGIPEVGEGGDGHRFRAGGSTSSQ